MFVYIDTSALAKWYLNEPGSDAFSTWIQQQSDTHISTLITLEMRCLLARRKRMGDITPELEQRIFAVFEDDVRTGHLIAHSVKDTNIADAVNLLDRVAPIGLRTLDALHLIAAMAMRATAVATADQTMAAATKPLELELIDFS